MILYNGQTGSLGRYFADALNATGEPGFALKSRLEDRVALRVELMQLPVFTPEQPITLVQMAAKVSVPACEADPAAAHKTNVLDTVATVSDFLDWARLRKLDARVVYVSTGHVYASSHEPLSESAPTGPRSVYATTKLAAEDLLQDLTAKQNVSLIIARVFGLVAPSQPAHYVLPGLLRRVRENDLIGVPGLDYTRDYLDARDVCRALVQLTEFVLAPCAESVVNVCSGKPKTIRQILDMIAWPRVINPIATPGHVGDADYIVGNPAKITAILGESPQTISLAQTISDTLVVGEQRQ